MSLRTVIFAIVLVAALAGGGMFLDSVVLDTGDGSTDDETDDADAVGSVDKSPETADRDGDTDADADDSERDAATSDERGTEESTANVTEVEHVGESDDATVDPTDTEAPSTQGDATVTDVPVALYSADPAGPLEDGRAYLYNATSEQRVATHNFSDGHETVFENLTRTTTYDLVVNVSYYPDETITFNPRISDQINETIGYEFRGADSYEIEWEVDQLPTNVEHDDDDAEQQATTLRGYSALDEEGNYYTTWKHPMGDQPVEYLYLAQNNVSYRNSSMAGSGWEQTNGHWGNPDGPRNLAAENGLSGIKEREFIKEKDVFDLERDTVHVYEVSEHQFDAPMIIHIDPETGYIVYTEIIIDEWSEPSSTRSIGEYHSHDEEIDIIPNSFPIEMIAD